MELFSLPISTRVNRVIPKNAFDSYTSAKQKKLFTELITRISWLYKISPETINLESKEIKEIQIFRIELKVKQEIPLVLDIIDKSIPYNIIFIVEYDGSVYLSTSSKHKHPINEDNSVIDWTFKSEWFKPSENHYSLELRKSIDTIYHDFCVKLSGKTNMAARPIQELIHLKKNIDSLEREISKLKTAIAGTKQFNSKVELNLKLKKLEAELANMNIDKS
jgi:hypothetical protein